MFEWTFLSVKHFPSVHRTFRQLFYSMNLSSLPSKFFKSETSINLTFSRFLKILIECSINRSRLLPRLRSGQFSKSSNTKRRSKNWKCLLDNSQRKALTSVKHLCALKWSLLFSLEIKLIIRLSRENQFFNRFQHLISFTWPLSSKTSTVINHFPLGFQPTESSVCWDFLGVLMSDCIEVPIFHS